MMTEQQEKWIKTHLKEGVVVKQQFPCMYDSENGFGYKIILVNGNKQFNVLVTYNPSSEKQGGPILLPIQAISHYTNRDEENITNTSLIGEKMLLTPVDEKTQMLDPYYSITGIFTLQ